MRRAWLLSAVLIAACGGWDQIATQSRIDRCAKVPDECDAGSVIVDPPDAGSDPGSDAGTDAGSGFVRCTDDAQCGDAGLKCHPTAKLCARTCTAIGPNCTKCDYPPGFNHGVRFCGCTSQGSCGSDQVCSGFDEICMPRCASDCPGGRVCSVTTGQCATPAPCTFGGCGPGFFCDSRQRVCSSTNCNATLPQPGDCPYGAYCSMTGRCVEPARATCSNVDAGLAPWTPDSMGPVIYAARPTPADAGGCFTGQRAYSTVLSVYSRSPLPASSSGLTDFTYYPPMGMPLAGGIFVTSYAPDGSVADLTVGVCGDSDPITLGYAFTGGNPFCVTLDGGVRR